MLIPITIAAPTFAILRTSRPHRLRELLAPIGAGYVRDLYGAPLALLLAGTWFGALDHPVPEVPARFWPIIATAGVAQIAATIALLRSFQARGFAVGTVYSKTEVIQVAIVGALVLGEPLRPLGWVEIGRAHV